MAEKGQGREPPSSSIPRASVEFVASASSAQPRESIGNSQTAEIADKNPSLHHVSQLL